MRTGLTQKMTLAGLLGALCAILAQVSVPIPPVPISLCSMAVLLAGALLGPKLGAAAVGGYVVLGAAGAPVFAGMGAGPGVLFGPTGGFLFGYILCAYLTGALVRRLGFTRRGLLLSMAAASLACYIPGAAWYALLTQAGLKETVISCALVFLPGDAVKVALTAMLCLRLEKPMRAMNIL